MKPSSIKLIYIAGPYTAPSLHELRTNINQAWECAIPVARHGGMPVIPHMNSAYFDDLQPPAFWYAATMRLLETCDAILLMPGWEMNKGAIKERERAIELGLRVFYFIEPLHMQETREIIAGRGWNEKRHGLPALAAWLGSEAV